jgi:diacylglycerol kinase family enzyme
LPGGTVNLLARDLGMATDLDTAIDQMRDARVVTIDAAEYNGNFFLCIANLGFSTRLTEYREKFRQHPAWVRWPLLGWQALNFLFAYPVMTIELEVEGRTHRLRTRSISISNNPLAEDSRLIPARPALDRRTLGIYASRDTSPWTLPRLALRWLVGNWPQDEDLLVFEAPRATIRCRPRRRMRVMCDGELDRLAPPLAFKIIPGSLRVLAPGGGA